MPPDASMQDRIAMYNANRLKIGLFGPNCSSGRAVTTVPERWSGSWEDNLALARMADEAGIDFPQAVAACIDVYIDAAAVFELSLRRGGGQSHR